MVVPSSDVVFRGEQIVCGNRYDESRHVSRCGHPFHAAKKYVAEIVSDAVTSLVLSFSTAQNSLEASWIGLGNLRDDLEYALAQPCGSVSVVVEACQKPMPNAGYELRAFKFRSPPTDVADRLLDQPEEQRMFLRGKAVKIAVH